MLRTPHRHPSSPSRNYVHGSSSGRNVRRALRRGVHTHGQAVELSDFRLLGDRFLDVSPAGLLLACDDRAERGDQLVVSFQTPGNGGPIIDAEAEVVRVVDGRREGDPGYCAGLRFTYLERSARHELLARLAGFPPPIPRNRSPRPAASRGPAVLMRPVVTLGGSQRPPGDGEVRFRAPLGAFASA